MRLGPKSTSFLAVLAISQPCVAQSPTRPDDARRAYQVVLLGNTGAGTMEQLEPTLRFARRRLMEAGENSAVVFLGDLLPCCGMPDSGTAGRAVAEERLMMLVDAVRDYPGRVLFIPGERDWGRNRREGWESLLRMEDFIEVTLDRGNIFVPDEGLPGPHEVELADDIRLVALNTQWLLTDNERSTGEAEDYEAEEDADFYVALEDLIAKRSTEDVIVVGHHPIYSHGRYGGHYPPKAHLFPLTLAWDAAWTPVLAPLALPLFLSGE